MRLVLLYAAVLKGSSRTTFQKSPQVVEGSCSSVLQKQRKNYRSIIAALQSRYVTKLGSGGECLNSQGEGKF